MDKQPSQHEQVKQLCNNVLYVLQHSYYRGEDAHLVELSKQFIIELKKDVDLRIATEAKAASDAKAATENLNQPAALEAK